MGDFRIESYFRAFCSAYGIDLIYLGYVSRLLAMIMLEFALYH